MAKNQKVEIENDGAAQQEELATSKALKYKTTRKVSKEVTKLSTGTTVLVMLTSAMYEGKILKNQRGSTEEKKPATLVDCVDLETGEESYIVVPTVLKGLLEDEYPNDTYVGKSFAIQKLGKIEKVGGQAYNKIRLEEIEVE